MRQHGSDTKRRNLNSSRQPIKPGTNNATMAFRPAAMRWLGLLGLGVAGLPQAMHHPQHRKQTVAVDVPPTSDNLVTPRAHCVGDGSI